MSRTEHLEHDTSRQNRGEIVEKKHKKGAFIYIIRIFGWFSHIALSSLYLGIMAIADSTDTTDDFKKYLFQTN